MCCHVGSQVAALAVESVVKRLKSFDDVAKYFKQTTILTDGTYYQAGDTHYTDKDNINKHDVIVKSIPDTSEGWFGIYRPFADEVAKCVSSKGLSYHGGASFVLRIDGVSGFESQIKTLICDYPPTARSTCGREISTFDFWEERRNALFPIGNVFLKYNSVNAIDTIDVTKPVLIIYGDKSHVLNLNTEWGKRPYEIIFLERDGNSCDKVFNDAYAEKLERKEGRTYLQKLKSLPSALFDLLFSVDGKPWTTMGLFFVPTRSTPDTLTALMCPLGIDDSQALGVFDALYWELQSLIRIIGAGVEAEVLLHKTRFQHQIASTQSAIGSIMSRNGSHNIGSHVLSALSHNVGTMPDDRVLYQYIQHRMDYIASATTGAPDWSVPTPFVGNLMKMFYSQRHLLDHIAESDGLHAYQYQGKGTQIGDGQSDCVKIVVRRISHSEGEVVGGKSVVEKEVFGKTVYVYEFFQKAPSTSENSDKVSKTEKNGDTSKTEKTDEAVKTVKWENDETVSIPGGILGQHAFYNIVENVLRNAAKHSWAGNKPEERGAENLEIYVDFEKNQPNESGQPDGMMCFTVGDNMSRLFSETFWDDCFRYLDSRDNTIPLPEGRTCWAEVFSLPLDGFHIPLEGETSNRQRIDEFLDGKASSEDLPPQYKALYKYIEHDWCNLIKSSSFMASLKGVPDKKENGDPDDSRPGHRLPLPLHHRQERILAKPFIDLETNRLRQAAWGLSEMKISAGYLRRAEVSVIGGLEQPKQGEHPLIVPLGVPRSAKGTATWKELCLAYRFWAKLPKDVLIVADDASCSSWSVKVGNWEGVEIKTFNEVLGPKGDIGLMSDYGFVIVDHVGGIEPDDLLKLPFRALRIAQGDEEMSGFPFVLRGELEKAEKRQELVECVYRAWLDYLKRRRYGKDEHKDLIIKMKISEKKGGEKGLISDRDIYKVLFRECLHSVLEPLVDKHKNLTDQERQAILLISLYPIDETDKMFEKNVEEQFKSEGDYPVATKKLLGEIADRVRAVLNGELEAPNLPSRDMVFRAWRTGLEHSGNGHPGNLIVPLLEFVRGDAHSTSVLNGIRDVLSGMKKCSRPSAALGSHSLSLDVAIQALETARTTSEVFLRKYEERITTLPQHYREVGLPEKETLPFNGFGVSVTYAETKADITYLRHSTDDATLYSEPLSGAQNYLNALSNLSCADAQWAMRLAENGLLRIAVIDERVCKFIADHGEEIRKTYVSMHIAVVDTNTNPVSNPEDLKFPDLTKLSFVVRNETDMDFDLVVVHQGIIDKWWPGRHGKKRVAKILGDLRNPGGVSKLAFPQRFVVVTTGRGRPDNIPETAKVLAFSSIEAFLFKRYPEKLNLVNSLMNILPGSPERSNDNG